MTRVNSLAGWMRVVTLVATVSVSVFAKQVEPAQPPIAPLTTTLDGAQIKRPDPSLAALQNPSLAGVAAASQSALMTGSSSNSANTWLPPLPPTAMPTAPGTPAVSITPTQTRNQVSAAPSGNELRITGLGSESAPWTIVILLTVLTLIPSILLCMTPFARLLIVFHFLRQALGLQSTPSNQTLIGLSLVLTFFLMQPVATVINRDSVQPLEEGKITGIEALERASVPMRHFMSHYVREKDVALFVELSKEPRPRTPDDLSMRVLFPAYILSELKSGFQIGAVLFLPFLVVDMVVASITTSVGMFQLPPVVISTPLKLLLFMMVDGWDLLIGSMMRSFN